MLTQKGEGWTASLSLFTLSLTSRLLWMDGRSVR